MRKALAVGAVLLVALGLWHTYRQIQRDACFTNGKALSEYNGMTVAEVVAAGDVDVVRVVGRDGSCLDVTSDLRDDRLSVYLEDGKVAQARRY